MLSAIHLGLLSWLIVGAPVQSADWSQFRGPGGNGVAEETGLPTQWSKTENIRWKTDLPGRGVSSPIVIGGRVFLTATTGVKGDRLHVLAFDARTGKHLWDRQFWATGSTACHPTTCMAGPTPCSDRQNVYALFGTGDVAAFDFDGNLLWYRSLRRDYPGITNQVGMAASPIVWKNVLLLPHENVGDSFVAGLDTATGQNLWKVERTRGLDWVTPFLVTRSGRTEVLFGCGADVTAYDPASGKMLWTYAQRSNNPVPMTVFGKELLLVPGEEFTALRPGADGKQPEAAWKNAKLRLFFSSPLYYQDRLWVLSSNVLNCADPANGEIVWQKRIKGQKFWASPVAADGKIYLVNQEGVTTVIQTGSEPQILGTNDLEDTILGTPALANGAIYMRSDKYLYCIGEKRDK